jgi:hypothetical protein
MLSVLAVTSGPVLEMGAGEWSTPALHQLCAFQDRLLVTVEEELHWLGRFVTLATDTHRLVPYAREARWLPARWSVTLIDQSEHRRAPDLLRVDSGVFVVHDTEPNHRMVYPGLHDALETFEYRADLTTLYPHTTLVSHDPLPAGSVPDR